MSKVSKLCLITESNCLLSDFDFISNFRVSKDMRIQNMKGGKVNIRWCLQFHEVFNIVHNLSLEMNFSVMRLWGLKVSQLFCQYTYNLEVDYSTYYHLSLVQRFVIKCQMSRVFKIRQYVKE